MEDVERVRLAVAAAADAYQQPIVYVTRVPSKAPAPDEPVRRHLDAVLPEIARRCSSYHVILEGAGFIAAVKRSVLTNLLQPIWRPRKFYVHAHATEVPPHLDATEQVNVNALLKRAQRHDLLTCGPPGLPARFAPPAAE